MTESTEPVRHVDPAGAHRRLLTLVSEIADIAEAGGLGDHTPDTFGGFVGSLVAQTLDERPTRQVTS